MDWRNFIKPGYFDERVRIVYFFIFLTVTVLQTYFALRMEEQIAIDDKYPDEIPSVFF